MNQHQDSHTGNDRNAPPVRKAGAGRRWMLAAAIVAAVGTTGLAGASYAGEAMAGMHGGHGGKGGHGGQGGHGGARHHGMDPARAAKHIDRMIAKIAPEATPQQQARLKEIANAAFADLKPLRAELRATHARVHQLLMAPAVDRAALEALRVEQVQRFDAVSKRMTAALADAADVLTPEQRLRMAEHMKKGMHH